MYETSPAYVKVVGKGEKGNPAVTVHVCVCVFCNLLARNHTRIFVCTCLRAIGTYTDLLYTVRTTPILGSLSFHSVSRSIAFSNESGLGRISLHLT